MTERPLSPRQLDVARLLGEGMTQQQVADELGISVRTVWHHAERLRAKTGTTSTAAALLRVRARPRVTH